jgi:bacteriocin biosynthesis cyclodehydratase domain-containing protein
MVRLKQALEVFPVGDGTVYLLRDGYLAEFVVDDVDEDRLALLRLLEQPRSLEELLASVAIPEPDLRGMLSDLSEVGALDDAPAEDRTLLSEEEWARYDRQLVYFADARPGRAAELQAGLRDATVAIVGVGGLGSWAAAGLASAGVGRLVLVDDDVVDLSNLNRQVLYRRSDVGRLKAEVAAEALAAFNPELTLAPVVERVDGAERAEAVVEGADFVVETADWPPFQLSRWLDAACWPRGVPRIVAAQFPPRVRIGPSYIPGTTGCLACQERALRRDHPLYDRVAEFRAGRPVVAATLGPASGIIGAAIAMDVVHHLTGIAAPATAGVGLTIDLRDWSVERAEVERDPDCPRCGINPVPHSI